VSFNEPQFCPTVKWNEPAVTFFQDKNRGSNHAIEIFIDIDNTIYAVNTGGDQILVWRKHDTFPMAIHAQDWCIFSSIFVSKIGDIYTSCNTNEIIRWIPSTNTFVNTTTFENPCYQIFIDINNYLYCSMWDTDTVAKRWLDNEMEITVVAGTGWTDFKNDRIVGSGPNGFRCLVGSNVPPTIQAVHSSILTDNHPTFSRTKLHPSNYYYEAIEVVVNNNSFYILTANSSADLYGHVYKHHFDRLTPMQNLIAWHGKCCNKDQFKFTLELLSNETYILVVTTYNPNVTGPFSITIFGSNQVHLKNI
ncbi:unnamed protein product, partial [Adineta ricciae]